MLTSGHKAYQSFRFSSHKVAEASGGCVMCSHVCQFLGRDLARPLFGSNNLGVCYYIVVGSHLRRLGFAFFEATVAAPFAFVDTLMPSGVTVKQSEITFWEAILRYLVSSIKRVRQAVGGRCRRRRPWLSVSVSAPKSRNKFAKGAQRH